MVNIKAQFNERLRNKLGRKLLAAPATYRLAREVFVRKGRFAFKAKKKLTAMALEQAAEAYQKKNPVAWTSAFFPSEMFYFFDLIPFAPEVAAGTSAALDLSPRLLRHAESMGLSPDSCSFHRCAAAGTDLDYFPRPDFLVASAHLCDGAPRLFQYMARRSRKPLYLLDVPAGNDDRALHYVADQLAEIASDLEKKRGIKLTNDRIAAVFEASNRARQFRIEVENLRMEVPTPLNGTEGLAYIYLMLLGQGHPETAAIYETLAGELKEVVRKNRGKAGKTDRERYRLIWLHLRPYYSSDLISYLENELKMVIAAEEMNLVHWPPLDPKKPFTSLARRVILHPGLGPIERRLKFIVQNYHRYRAHGVIHFSHWGCRQSVGGILFLKKELQKRNIPFLAVDGDCIDGTGFPREQVLTRIDSFHEILEELYA